MTHKPDEKTLLEEVEKAIDACANFKKIPPPPGAEAYDGTANGWRILVLTFTTPQGRGYDGTASGTFKEDLALAEPRLIVMRLTRALAEKAIKLAEKQVLS